MVLANIDVFCGISTSMSNRLIKNNVFKFQSSRTVECQICKHLKKGKVLKSGWWKQ